MSRLHDERVFDSTPRLTMIAERELRECEQKYARSRRCAARACVRSSTTAARDAIARSIARSIDRSIDRARVGRSVTRSLGRSVIDSVTWSLGRSFIIDSVDRSFIHSRIHANTRSSTPLASRRLALSARRRTICRQSTNALDVRRWTIDRVPSRRPIHSRS